MKPKQQKAHRLEMLLRQQHCWFIEANEANKELVERLRAEVKALKKELNVTDEELFLKQRSSM